MSCRAISATCAGGVPGCHVGDQQGEAPALCGAGAAPLLGPAHCGHLALAQSDTCRGCCDTAGEPRRARLQHCQFAAQGSRLPPRAILQVLQALSLPRSAGSLQDNSGRHPYEVLLLMEPTGPGSASAGQHKLPERLTLMSVPLQHSRKPQLASLLQQWLPERPRCLEVGALVLY